MDNKMIKKQFESEINVMSLTEFRLNSEGIIKEEVCQ